MVKLDGGIEVSGAGTLSLKNGAEVDGRAASILAGFTVGGAGTWDFGSGYIGANMVFGPNVTFRIYDPSSVPTDKHMQTTGGQGVTVTAMGTTLQSGEAVQVVSATQIVNQGGWHITHGGFSGTGTAQFLGNGSQQLAGKTTVKGQLNTGINYAVTAGSLTSSGTIAGSVRNAGVVQPGNAIGKLTITHSYTQVAGGDLRIELKNGSFDQLAVGGAVILAGDLHLVLKQGPPLSKVSRKLITAASRTGTLHVVFGAIPAAQWKVVYATTSVRLVPR